MSPGNNLLGFNVVFMFQVFKSAVNLLSGRTALSPYSMAVSDRRRSSRALRSAPWRAYTARSARPDSPANYARHLFHNKLFALDAQGSLLGGHVEKVQNFYDVRLSCPPRLEVQDPSKLIFSKVYDDG